ncbi:hypothetical protein [Herbaspirillum sp. ST 5-3]|uniref:hypothetical protein n=1 Tax=Oxalobacteraceae TaxID=75682 RepID=UPI0010A494E2|nr:hypothetical protein [Herbaspirillum sp. ST 5-3]
MTTWDQRVKASLEAGKKPAYSDYEEGLEYTMKELKAVKAVLQDISGTLAQIVIARMHGDATSALEAIDKVIENNVIVTAPGDLH